MRKSQKTSKSRVKTIAALITALTLTTSIAHAQSWDEIDMSSQTMLHPLRGAWEQMPASKRQSWLQYVPKMQKMSAEELSNAQERMAEWASFSTKQQNQVETKLQNNASNNPETRSRLWGAYLKLH